MADHATLITEEFQRGGIFVTRQIWVSHLFGTLSLSDDIACAVRALHSMVHYTALLEPLLGTGVTLSDIFTTLSMAWVLVVCGLVGAFVASTYKWGDLVFGCFGLFYICQVLTYVPSGRALNQHRLHVGIASSDMLLDLRRGRCYDLSASAIYAAQTISAPSFSCSIPSAGHAMKVAMLSLTGEMIWYGILDSFSGPILLFFFLWNLTRSTLALSVRFRASILVRGTELLPQWPPVKLRLLLVQTELEHC